METTVKHYGHPVAVTLTLEVEGAPRAFCFDFVRGMLFTRKCRQDEVAGIPCGSIDMTRMSSPAVPAPAPPKQIPARGLGDVVAKVASALGIKQKPGCGCKRRQEKLNKLVPFKPGGA